MEETKYYTPTPEDIRTGMMYEYKRWADDDACAWDKRVMPANGIIIQNVLERLKRDTPSVRVPYITAEQIEAEGWTVDEDFPAHDGQILPFILNFENDQTSWYYHLWHNPDDSGMEITRYQGSDMQTVFHGSCRCINDFKAIIRLCNII